MDNKQLIFWAIVLVVMSIAEAASVQLIAIWFVAGAVVAFITALFTDALWLQLTIFLVCAIGLLILTRPIINKYLNSKVVPTNLDMNIGRTGIVKNSINIDSVGGRVVVDGVEWLAISENGDSIPEGTKVEVKEIKGAKLIVSAIN